jgi:type II secretory pathway component PulF
VLGTIWEVDDSLWALIEPILIIVMAVGVGMLLLSVLMPMFKLISNIGGSMGK